MNLPKDPLMLMSYLNTQLRDNYPSLAEFCAAQGISEEEILAKLAQVGYVYERDTNKFVLK